MARTKTSSIIKTRSQSRTGTTARTIAPAPAPVAVATGGRTTGTTNDPVAVATTNDPAPAGRTIDSVNPVAAATGRPTLKDPPPAVPTTGMKPAPRDHDSDRDSDDDAKKPAAKPTKGRPKKVAPKTRKPRKPRTVDANELVDPMANIHVGVVTAGGYAEATGNDPVLANPEQLAPKQPEPQPKKTRRTPRASRAHRAGHGDDDDDEDSYSTVGTGTASKAQVMSKYITVVYLH